LAKRTRWLLSSENPLRKTTEQYQRELDEKFSGTLKVLEEYKTNQTSVLHVCTICETRWNTTPSMMLAWSGGCRNCRKGNSHKTVEVKGKIFRIQGFERKALKLLLEIERLSPKKIHEYSSGNVPFISYTYKGKACHYRPDFYIKSQNLLVEVKSPSTLGLDNRPLYESTGRGRFRKNKAKWKAALDQGYSCRLILLGGSNGRHYYELPVDWFEMNLNQFRAWYKRAEPVLISG